MAVTGQVIDAIVHEYLQKKDKNLAQVFQNKTKAVCTSAMHIYHMYLHTYTKTMWSSAHE